ncbi:MAG: hypothetical protein ABIY55_31755, partial [Kofleriaceae bacterium]
MYPSPSRAPVAWVVAAHVLGAAAIGALDGAKLGGGLGLVLVPLFAMTGLVAGVLVGASERAAAARPWWV